MLITVDVVRSTGAQLAKRRPLLYGVVELIEQNAELPGVVLVQRPVLPCALYGLVLWR
jgi:hypothetical protein